MKFTLSVFLIILTTYAIPGVIPKRGIRGSKNHAHVGIEQAVPRSETKGGLRNRGRAELSEIRTTNRRISEYFEGIGRDDGSVNDTCMDKRVTQTWSNIKLSPENSIPRLTGFDSASGTAEISLTVAESCTLGAVFEVCVSATIYGFIPWRLHLTRGKILNSGPEIADFSDQLDEIDSDHKVCTPISENLYLELIQNPDEFHVSALAGGAIGAAGTHGIRGQLVQGFQAVLQNQQTVAPYDNVIPDASGTASMTVESAGQIICFDASIDGFDPRLAHLRVGEVGTNGNLVIDFSTTKVGTGHYMGCVPIGRLGIDTTTVLAILAHGERYYFEFHDSESEPDFYTTIRGQLSNPADDVFS